VAGRCSIRSADRTSSARSCRAPRAQHFVRDRRRRPGARVKRDPQEFFEARTLHCVIGVGMSEAPCCVAPTAAHIPVVEGFDVTVVGLANSKRFADAGGVDLSQWKRGVAGFIGSGGPRAFAHRLAGMQLTNAALVDCGWAVDRDATRRSSMPTCTSSRPTSGRTRSRGGDAPH
jgi:hypothetical protein